MYTEFSNCSSACIEKPVCCSCVHFAYEGLHERGKIIQDKLEWRSQIHFILARDKFGPCRRMQSSLMLIAGHVKDGAILCVVLVSLLLPVRY